MLRERGCVISLCRSNVYSLSLLLVKFFFFFFWCWSMVRHTEKGIKGVLEKDKSYIISTFSVCTLRLFSFGCSFWGLRGSATQIFSVLKWICALWIIEHDLMPPLELTTMCLLNTILKMCFLEISLELTRIIFAKTQGLCRSHVDNLWSSAQESHFVAN